MKRPTPPPPPPRKPEPPPVIFEDIEDVIPIDEPPIQKPPIRRPPPVEDPPRAYPSMVNNYHDLDSGLGWFAWIIDILSAIRNPQVFALRYEQQQRHEEERNRG